MVLVAQEVAEVQGLSGDDIIVDNYRSIYGGDDVGGTGGSSCNRQQYYSA